jgi:hypothetical protein
MSTIKLPELPAPFEPDWPDLNPHALGCGVEDRGIVSRYDAAEYGFQDGVDKAAQCVPEDIYTGEQMRAYAEEAVRQALAAQVPVAWMTEDGRVSTAETKRTAMPRASQEFFCIPLALIPEKDHGEST